MSWKSKFKLVQQNVPKGIRNLIPAASTDSPSSPNAEIRKLIGEWFDSRKDPGKQLHENDLKRFKSLSVLESDDHEFQAAFVDCLVPWLSELDRMMYVLEAEHGPYSYLQKGRDEIWCVRRLLNALLNKLLARRLPVSGDTWRAMLVWSAECITGYCISDWYPVGALISNFEEQSKTGPLPVNIATLLEELGKKLRIHETDNAARKLADRVDALLGRAPELPIIAGEAWADAAIEDLSGIEVSTRGHWAALLQHCKTAPGGSPSKKWLTKSQILLARLDRTQTAFFVARWLSLCDRKRTCSTLTSREWAARCAVEAFNKRSYEVLQFRPEGSRSWKVIESYQKSIRNAGNPWEYLREFHNLPEVRGILGDAFPPFQIPDSPPAHAPLEDLQIIPPHMDLLVGLAWCCGLLKNAMVTRALGLLAVSAYRKVPGIGPRAVRVGNSAITALGMTGDADALGQLSLLKVKVKFGGAQIAIDKAMTTLAEKLEIPREDLEEMSVPAYGMKQVGHLTQEIGDFTAAITIVNSRKTELTWSRADGKSQKSLPAVVKAEFAEDVKELMAAKKDIEKMLPAQAERLDSFYLLRKSWPLAAWRERYFDHPLIGALARRLLWNFTLDGTTQTGVWLKEKVVDRLGNPLVLEGRTEVSLWHPLHQDPTVVLGWRGFLEEWEIVQPFKQAHREIYLLTPAEEQTLVYSNRFAAHLLRQHQFHALCGARGWKNRLRLMVDDEYPPATRHLPAWGLRAEYWIEGAGDDMLESGAYRYLATDQIRFYQEGAPGVSAHAGGGGYGQRRGYVIPSEPVPLTQVDPLVFSEIMRDADLFVGVASVGNDPNWLDGGQNETQRDYWGSYSFGELNASANTRRTILERLVPKLRIAGVCSFEEKFLIVRGKRHSYKIHLGSGNILITPQDKYLCIVPAQGQVDKAGEKIFLPFEGDRILSVILSKAFLLAADDKITDTTILRQLG